MEPIGKTEERAPHTDLEENTHGRTSSEKHLVDRIQENGKEQDEVESDCTKVDFATKSTTNTRLL